MGPRRLERGLYAGRTPWGSAQTSPDEGKLPLRFRAVRSSPGKPGRGKLRMAPFAEKSVCGVHGIRLSRVSTASRHPNFRPYVEKSGFKFPRTHPYARKGLLREASNRPSRRKGHLGEARTPSFTRKGAFLEATDRRSPRKGAFQIRWKPPSRRKGQFSEAAERTFPRKGGFRET